MNLTSTNIIVFDTTKFQLLLCEDSILNLHIKEDQYITISDVEQYYDLATQLLPKKKYPVMHTIGIGASVDHDVREFASKNERRISLADGLVIDNMANRILARFYIKFHKPKITTAIFTNKNDALEWLRKFI